MEFLVSDLLHHGTLKSHMAMPIQFLVACLPIRFLDASKEYMYPGFLDLM